MDHDGEEVIEENAAQTWDMLEFLCIYCGISQERNILELMYEQKKEKAVSLSAKLKKLNGQEVSITVIEERIKSSEMQQPTNGRTGQTNLGNGDHEINRDQQRSTEILRQNTSRRHGEYVQDTDGII
jgi:hypothetical protein